MEWLTDLAPEMTGWNKFKNSMGEAKDFIREQMEYHKSSFQEGSYRDFMDVFINEINHTSDPNSAFYKIAGGRTFEQLLHDKFLTLYQEIT